MEASRAVIHQIRHHADPAEALAPFWNNIYFTALDAAALTGLLLSRRPRRYLEIGSGHSTKFAAHAIRSAALPTTISSIDPRPRADIDALCHRKIRAPLERCQLALFDELEAGDFLFFDGSHRIFQNSDVTAFFLDVVPRLKRGVLVHVHGIFLPPTIRLNGSPRCSRSNTCSQRCFFAIRRHFASYFQVISSVQTQSSARVCARVFGRQMQGATFPFTTPTRARLRGTPSGSR
jgi:Methyltransferase domain